MPISPVSTGRNSYLSQKHEKEIEEKRIAAEKAEEKRIEKKPTKQYK
jgi:hypothetical protein